MKPFARINLSSSALRRGILVSSLALAAAGIGAYGATPVAVSLGITFPEPTDVYGLHLSPIAIGEGPLTVTGLSLGAVDSLVMDEVRGIQVAGLFSFGWPSGPDKTRIYGCQMGGAIAGADCVAGIQAAGVFAGTDDMKGIQLAGLFSITGEKGIRGVQIAGLLSQSHSCRGGQIAFWNGSESMCGVQIGLMNFAIPADDGWVLQMGLVNGIRRDSTKSGWIDGMRYFPVVNLGW